LINNKKKVVIVGGGTAGLTIANSIQNYFNVVVIEKSKYKKYPIWYRIPLLIGVLLRKKNTKYIFKKSFILPSGRHIPFFESNVLGGASVINGCVHMLGNKTEWCSILKRFNANYEDLTESYNQLYSLNPKSRNKINLTFACQNIIDKAFIRVLNKQKIPIGDMNHSDKEACGPILNTAKKYFRTSVLSIFSKKKFETCIGESVENILFNDSGEITGVRTDKRVIESDYVILSGGVIGTCDLLLGQKYNITGESILNNLAVGKNIQDHTNLRINVRTNKSINSLNEISNSFNKKFILLFRHIFGKSTLMKGTGATSAAHLDLNNDGVIDTRIQVVQFVETGRHVSDGKLFSSTQPGFSISITAIHPSSKGEIIKDESDVVVMPMYLSSKEDIDLLKLALKFCLNLLKSSPINEHILKIEEEFTIKNNPKKYIVDNIFSGYHLIGGTHDAINSNFEVHNTKGLYVCDASVFNKYSASNIHSSVILISDIFAKKFIARNFHH
jgi:choline dehydrogenase-like flavoprotein